MKLLSAPKRDPFYQQLTALVFPIMIQSFMLALVSATDAAMLGIVNQESLSAVSLAGQVQFVLNLFVTGIAAGTGIIAAQYWGKGDPASIEQVIPVALRANLICGVLFTLCAFFAPRWLMLIFTDELPLIELGAAYLRAVSSSYLLCAISQIYLIVLKNTGAAAMSSRISSSAVVLNIDDDHLDYFGTVENAMRSFTRFAGMARRVLYNGDDANTVRAMEAAPTPEKLTFGRGEENDFWPAHLQKEDGLCRSFTLMHRGEALCRLTIHVPGEHNILNAVAAAAMAWLLGVAPEAIAVHLAQFTGAGRRFEVLGKVRGVTIVDDYAHHPAELAATLRAAKELGFRQVWAVFQPFTFSRTYLLLEEFAAALSIADQVVLSPIMGSREKNQWGIRSEDLGAKLPGCVCLPGFPEMADYVMENAQEGDLVLTLGCGDVYKCARMMLLK